MIQSRGGTGFSTETFERLGVFRKGFRKELESHEPPKFGVLSLVHDTHPTTTELF
jgi:hypothetical protein